MEDFIGIYDNVLSSNDCNKLIDWFEECNKYNAVIDHKGYTKAPDHLTRKDETVFALRPETISLPNNANEYLIKFSESFWNCYEDYTNKYTVLQTSPKHGFYLLRIQKTKPGGGFHTWHYENFDLATSSRLVAFQLYLNDVHEGGETEYLYLQKRVQPKQGRLLIWPTGYTHTHRGNPPLTNDKYIITGWLNFFE